MASSSLVHLRQIQINDVRNASVGILGQFVLAAIFENIRHLGITWTHINMYAYVNVYPTLTQMSCHNYIILCVFVCNKMYSKVNVC